MKRVVHFLVILCCFSCSNEDIIPSTLMNFEEVAELGAQNVHNAAGFLASKELNSLFIASREPNPETQRLGERLLRYDISDGSITADYTDITDFVTKEIHIIEDEIVVVAGQFVNTYDLSFQAVSTTVSHGLTLSRFGSVLYNGEIYIWGGDLNDVDSNKIKKWDRNSSSFLTIATLPARKAGAHGEVIGDKLYIFGGQEHWLNEPPNDLIIIYDFVDDTFETSLLPMPVFRTFTDVYKGKIFIAGQLLDNDPFTDDLDIFLAAFDPSDNSVQLIDTSLSQLNFRTIHQMAIINKDMYILYGDVGEDPGKIKLMRHKL